MIASKIQDISNNLKEKREMAVSYHFNAIEQGGLSNNARSVTWHDPRMAALLIEVVELCCGGSPSKGFSVHQRVF